MSCREQTRAIVAGFVVLVFCAVAGAGAIGALLGKMIVKAVWP